MEILSTFVYSLSIKMKRNEKMKRFIMKIGSVLGKEQSFPIENFEAYFKEKWNDNPNFKRFMIGFIRRDKNAPGNVLEAMGHGEPIFFSRRMDNDNRLFVQTDSEIFLSFTNEELDFVEIPKPLKKFESFIYSSNLESVNKLVLDSIFTFVNSRITNYFSVPELQTFKHIRDQLNELNEMLTEVSGQISLELSPIKEEILEILPALKEWVDVEESKYF